MVSHFISRTHEYIAGRRGHLAERRQAGAGQRSRGGRGRVLLPVLLYTEESQGKQERRIGKEKQN